MRDSIEAADLALTIINLRLAEVRRLAAEAADNGLLAPELTAGILRVRGVRKFGQRLDNWLSREQARKLLAVPDTATQKGERDRALLAVLLGCGLRRAEVVALTLGRLQQREGRRVLLDLAGKGRRLRMVPMPAWVKAVGLRDGCLFRAVEKAGGYGRGNSSRPEPIRTECAENQPSGERLNSRRIDMQVGRSSGHSTGHNRQS